MLFCCSKDEGSERILLSHFVYIILKKYIVERSRFQGRSRVSEIVRIEGGGNNWVILSLTGRKNLFGNSFEFRFWKANV